MLIGNYKSEDHDCKLNPINQQLEEHLIIRGIEARTYAENGYSRESMFNLVKSSISFTWFYVSNLVGINKYSLSCTTRIVNQSFGINWKLI